MIYVVIIVVVASYVLERIVPCRQLPAGVSRLVTALCLYVIGEAMWLLVFSFISDWVNEAMGPQFLDRHPQFVIFGLPMIRAVVIAVLKPVRRRENGADSMSSGKRNVTIILVLSALLTAAIEADSYWDGAAYAAKPAAGFPIQPNLWQVLLISPKLSAGPYYP